MRGAEGADKKDRRTNRRRSSFRWVGIRVGVYWSMASMAAVVSEFSSSVFRWAMASKT